MFSDSRPNLGDRGIKICQFIFIIIIIIFAFRLFYLQVFKGDFFKKQSVNNRISEQRIKSPRGLIYDSQGFKLATNRPSINVYITMEKTKNHKTTLGNLASIIKTDINSLTKKIKNKNRYNPILLLRDINQETLAKIQENKIDLPGVSTKSDLVREYPDGHFYAHLIGYLREINNQFLEKNKLKNYKSGDYTGRKGIEKTHEMFLRGEVGKERIEVDAHGRKKRTVTPFHQKSGNNLHLTINLRLQKKISELFSTHEGSVIALNPNNGSVLSMVSHPHYNPNLFRGRISKKDWDFVNNNHLKPLLNRSIKSGYPPGSIFKTIMAFAFLSHPDFKKENEFFCNGKIRIGKERKEFRCWKKQGHGKIGLKDAIAQSCDVYFFKAGRIMGIDHIANYAARFGLGEKTGFSKIEKKGILPSKIYKKKNEKDKRWYLGDTFNMSIGQGYHSMTPIQVASLTSSIANGGKIYQPYIVEKITSADGKQIFKQKPIIRRSIHDKNKFLGKVRSFLKETVNSEKGTGKKAKSNLWIISGKTGTAQAAKLAVTGTKKNSEETKRSTRDHSWFIAFAPYKNPEIALVIFAEHTGLHGSYFAPMAKEIIEFYIKGKRGISIDE